MNYTCRHLQIDWRAQVPDDIEIRFVDQSLIDDGIEVHGAATDVLELRQNAPEPARKAVGFVAIRDSRIVASSVIDCIVGTGGDIGLFTDPDQRRRNLAYLTAAAVIEYALSHGIDVVHWDCDAFNTGSIRTAEKLGLQFSHRHNMYILILYPVRHELNRAWSQVNAGRYEQAIAICQTHIETEGASVHPEFHYIVARCHLAENRPDDAVQALQLAAKSGWKSLDEMQADFSALADHPSWGELLDQVRGNIDAKS